MASEFAREYVDFLNALDVVLKNDNIRFVMKRRNFIFPPDQLGAVVEKCHINLVIDGKDHFFSMVYANPSSRTMKVKYNEHYLDEILMCIKEEVAEFYELDNDDIHLHVWKFNKKHFTELIQRIIIEQKRFFVMEAFLGVTINEARKTVLYYRPKWADDLPKDNTKKEAVESIKAIREIVSELYDDRIGSYIEIKYPKKEHAYYNYELFTKTSSLEL